MNEFLEFLTPAQIIGVIASVCIIGGYFSKVDDKAKKIIMCGCILFAVHFFIVEAMTAALMNLVNFFRVLFSIKFHGSKKFLVFFVVVYLVVAFISYEYWLDILPVIASLLGCLGMYVLSGIRFRVCQLLGSSCWITHNVIVGSIGGTITEVFVIFAHVTTIFRLWFDNRKLKNETSN